MVGVNSFTTVRSQESFDVLSVDAVSVRQDQVSRLQQIKNSRDQEAVNNVLHAIRKACDDGNNLLELAVRSCSSSGNLREISEAMESSFTRYTPKSALISGVYAKQMTKRAFKKPVKWFHVLQKTQEDSREYSFVKWGRMAMIAEQK